MQHAISSLCTLNFLTAVQKRVYFSLVSTITSNNAYNMYILHVIKLTFVKLAVNKYCVHRALAV